MADEQKQTQQNNEEESAQTAKQSAAQEPNSANPQAPKQQEYKKDSLQDAKAGSDALAGAYAKTMNSIALDCIGMLMDLQEELDAVHKKVRGLGRDAVQSFYEGVKRVLKRPSEEAATNEEQTQDEQADSQSPSPEAQEPIRDEATAENPKFTAGDGEPESQKAVSPLSSPTADLEPANPISTPESNDFLTAPAPPKETSSADNANAFTMSPQAANDYEGVAELFNDSNSAPASGIEADNALAAGAGGGVTPPAA